MVFVAADPAARNPQSEIRILIVAAYPIARAGLAALLGVFTDIMFVGQSAGGADWSAVVEETTPDVILLDHTPGDEEALERLEHILAGQAATAALVLGAERTEEALLEA